MDTLPIPTSPDQLTAEWITFALASGGLDGVSVSEIQVNPLDATSGASGTYAVVELRYSNRVEGAPDTLFAKMTDESLRDFLGNSFVREISVYREYIPKLQISTPRLFFGVAEAAGGPAILLIEDLSAYRLGDFNVGASEAEIEAAITTLATAHSAYWGDDDLIHDKRLLSDGYAGHRASYQMSEMAAAQALGIAKQEGVSEYIDKALINLADEFEALGARIMSPPRTLSHNDYRIDNLLYSGPAEKPGVTVFDWGTVGSLRGTYDLASFLTSAYLPDTEESARSPVDLYHQTLLESGVTGYSREDLQVDYATAALLMLHRRVVGTYWARTRGQSEGVLGMRRTGLQRCARHIELLKLGDILN